MRAVLWKSAAFFTVAMALVVLGLSGLIWRQAHTDEAKPADAIVVLGAAEYRGRPSPVLKARLDHALDLYRQNLAPRIITTGGHGGDPDFTEGGVGRRYLIENRVPAEAILVEDEGESTAHSVAGAGEIMKQLGLRSCIVVTDGYHVLRAKAMLESRGLDAYGSPRPSSTVPSGWTGWMVYPRESVGFLLWAAGLR